jgi:phytoene synthase
MTPDEYCRARAGGIGSSLYYSLRFLPPPHRRAVTALHALRREIGAAVDASTEASVAGAALAWWEAEIDRLFAATPQHPITRALAPHVPVFGLARQPFDALIAGMRVDLAQNRFLDFAALERYCVLVGGSIAELAATVFGATGAASADHARRLGTAVQLIERLRATGADARSGRIYLPMDEMRREGVTAADILAGRPTQGFEALMGLQARRARALLAQALASLPAADLRAQRPGLILAALRAALLDELEREHYRVLHQRIALTPVRKLLIAWRTWVFGVPRSLTSPAAPPAPRRPDPPR